MRQQTSLACVCFPNEGHVKMFQKTVSFKFYLIHVHMKRLRGGGGGEGEGGEGEGAQILLRPSLRI